MCWTFLRWLAVRLRLWNETRKFKAMNLQIKLVGLGVQFLRWKMSQSHWHIITSLLGTYIPFGPIFFSEAVPLRAKMTVVGCSVSRSLVYAGERWKYLEFRAMIILGRLAAIHWRQRWVLTKRPFQLMATTGRVIERHWVIRIPRAWERPTPKFSCRRAQ